ncbi:Dna-J like membrane chaperone protein [Spiribacter salinus M19-40]|jgi:DnaJ like chaperone protein|uniref:Co-chaperone protein DjlA n=2 Tax=Spiribacter salinus TaxID=1335746 RepID=R4VCW8_9GAMM|nr:co-chaperone DjlA [Spiribacter salinus]AGM40181.1 Dna-J like membrane chaperone protein [Spiribacter salinus M19-40]MBY5268588.1 molecular chaperone DjlA [Spiribacter salinus]MDR9414090.1 co-chaperone DjlA [Spiribacter sp.]TQE98327.1 MAG: co-chaperone DjlA [Spiribacter salinus]
MRFWIGKLLGTLFGSFAGGWVGAIVGFIIGNWFDRALSRGQVRGFAGAGSAAHRQMVHAAFFRSVFVVMGHVCKADGRVTEAEIRVAKQVMQRMDLNATQREEAISYFKAGRDGDADLDQTLQEFRRYCRGHVQLVRMFLEIQIQAALADGRFDEAERAVLRRIALGLGLSEEDYARLETMMGGQAANQKGGESELAAAYDTLGVNANATDAEVKRAWRRLMSEHHPDKLVAKGLPEEMMRIAKERAQEIQSAYDSIKQARGMR